MTNERNDSVPTQSRILFVCGMVLGVCLGFAAGHLSVWSRLSPEAAADPSASSWASQDWPTVPPLGRAGLAESEGYNQQALDPNRPQPFFAAAARRLAASAAVNVTRSQEPTRMAAGVSATVTEPEGLAHTHQAVPIDEEATYQEQITRAIIAEELPQASTQELDVWFDVLRGLDPADVKGILRMRKHVGGQRGMMAGTPVTLPDPVRQPANRLPESPSPAVNHEWAQTIDCLQRVRSIRLHNLCNADTVGYQRLVPVLADIRHGNRHQGVELSRIEHRVTVGEFHQTGRPLDFAIDGPGFLQVTSNDNVRLTRNGRLKIDEERHLALADPSQAWRIDPPIVVPDEAGSLIVDSDGRVTVKSGDSADSHELGTILLKVVLDPSALQYTGEGLYETTSGSGAAYQPSAGSTLRQFGVEKLPRRVIDEEYESLEREERLIERLRSPAGTATVTDNES